MQGRVKIVDKITAGIRHEGKAIFILAFKAHLCISKGIKAKRKVLCYLVYVCLYFVGKCTKAKTALTSMPFCRASRPLPKIGRQWPLWPSLISSPFEYYVESIFHRAAFHF